jgi:hypothetical protein
VDIDAMERCNGGSHPSGKRDRAFAAESRLNKLGVQIGNHPVFGRADIVAMHPSRGTTLVEVEGASSRQREQAIYSALGQAVLMMRPDRDDLSYALAVPDDGSWEAQLRKIPSHVLKILRLRLYLVSGKGVRELDVTPAPRATR